MAAFEGDDTHMREMIFGAAPPWDEIIRGLRDLQDRINAK